jgi:ribose 5-phosphate isomerase A
MSAGQAQERQKQRAAEAAVTMVESGMVLGVGAGSTTALAAAGVAERLARGSLRDITCVPASEAVARHLRALGLDPRPLSDHPRIDLTIDGADEVDPALDLIKGAGGALLREKMVAQASGREVIICDEGKLSPRLGTRSRVPVEVFPFGWRAEELFLRGLGTPTLRVDRTGAAQPFVTDEGNYILDCDFGPIADARGLARSLEERAGIAAHGLFLALATAVLVGTDEGVRTLRVGR